MQIEAPPKEDSDKTIKSSWTRRLWEQLSWQLDNVLSVDASVDQGDGSIEGTLAWYVANVGSDLTTITIKPGTYLVSTSITVPTTMTLKPERGGIFTDDASNATLTINGHIDAGLYQIFDFENGSGTVDIDPSSVRELYPDWWGVTRTSAISDAVKTL